jgi:hypothetical protein
LSPRTAHERGRLRRGAELRVGDRVHLKNTHGEWTVLPLDDGCRWLGRRSDGALVALVPDEEYEVL